MKTITTYVVIMPAGDTILTYEPKEFEQYRAITQIFAMDGKAYPVELESVTFYARQIDHSSIDVTLTARFKFKTLPA